MQTAAWLLIVEFQTNRVQAVFVSLEHDQRCWFERGDLAAQFRSNGAAGAGHHYATTVNQPFQGTRVEADRRTRQQVFDRKAANVRDPDIAVDEIAQRRQRLDGQTERAKRAQNAANL